MKLRAALLDLVSPEHIAVTSAVFAFWVTLQVVLAPVSGVLMTGFAAVVLGQAGADLILGLINTTLAINRAKCRSDLDAVATTLAIALSQKTGSYIESTLLRKVIKSTEKDLGAPAIARVEKETSSGKKPTVAVPGSPIDYKHTIGADYTKRGRPSGGHSLLNGDVRIVPGTESAPNAVGVYRATIQVPDPKNPGQWITKTSNNGVNTMFPKDWGAERIKYEVDAAWNSPGKKIVGDEWFSTTPAGVRVRGFLTGRVTVFPLY